MTRRADKKNRKPLNRKKLNRKRLALETLEARTVLDAAMSAAMVSFMGEDLVGKDGPMASLGWDLTLLYHDTVTAEPDAPDVNDPGESDDSAGFTRNEFKRDQMQIENDHIHLQLVAANASVGDAMISSLTDLGMNIVASNEMIASGWVPIDALGQVAALESIQVVSTSYKPITSIGSVDSQGDAAMMTDDVRTSFGVDGSGIKIGAISDSYDGGGTTVSDTAAENVISGDLPGFTNPNGYTTPVEVLADASGSDEGRAMLQLIHDVAPGAELAFHSVGNSTLEFANAIRSLNNSGADVIVDDVGFGNEPFFMDGIVSQAVDESVANGSVYLTSAGNSARQSFEQQWIGSGTVLVDGDITGVTAGETMDFDPLGGTDDRQSFEVGPGLAIRLYFQWDDPFFTDSFGQNGADTDLDIFLFNNGAIVASSTDSNVGGDPFEFISFGNATAQTQSYEIMIVHVTGPAPSLVKYISPRTEFMNLEYDTHSGPSWGHSISQEGMGIGAAEWISTPEFGVDPAELEYFSSVGGTPNLFDASGLRTPRQVRPQPSIVAPDGANTTFFGGDSANDVDSDPNFFGTSAAAPHAAAVAALMLSANPSLTPAEVRDILQTTAFDMDDPFTPEFDLGFDYATGHGYINAIGAVSEALDLAPSTPTPPGGGGGETTDPDHGCGDDFNLPTNVDVQGAVGSNVFVSGHSILDNGTSNGQLGYDAVVLDFLRGDGTFVEIEKSDYSVAIIGNDGLNWSFTDGSQELVGYAATHFYDIDLLSGSGWADVLEHDALIIMSHDSVVTGGLTDAQLTVLASASDLITDAVNDYGLDIWVNSAGDATGMYDFLPAGILTQATIAASIDSYSPSTEGALFGLTSTMANSSDATTEFSSYDSDFFLFENRGSSEVISLAAQSIGFVNGQFLDATSLTSTTLSNLQGVSFNDLNQNGKQDANEEGLEGFTFYIDEDGDGQVGLCEPSAVSDEDGNFLLYTHQPGEFIIQPVLEQGYLPTDDLVRTVSISDTGVTEVNAPLDFGYTRAVDTGNAGNPAASHPVIHGFKLGDSPLLDDGVIFAQGLTIGAMNTATITSSTPLSSGILQGWVDFNRDGDWDDSGEQIFTNLALSNGTNNYSFKIPSTAFDDSSFSDALRVPAATRFRLDYSRDLTPTSTAFSGEVEDYEVLLASDPDSGIRLSDDSFYYAENTAGQFFHVLDNDNHLLGKDLAITSVTNVSPINALIVFSVAADGNSVLLDTTGLIDLVEDITFTYDVVDSSGKTASADVTLTLGSVGGLPISSAAGSTSAFTNSLSSQDVNNDGIVTFLDVAKILKALQHGGSRALPRFVPNQGAITSFIDTDGNNRISPIDLLSVIDFIRSGSFAAEPEAEFIETIEVSASHEIAQTVVESNLIAAEETQSLSEETQFVDWALNWRSNSAASSRVETESSLSKSSSELSKDSFFEGIDTKLSQVIADASDDDQWYLASDLEESIDGLALELNEKWEDELEDAV
ncbi:MAG: S8 family serine peptidase [Pirellulales bacterium]